MITNRVKDGFTLIELLVVISIIALLIAILLPSLGQAKKVALRAACASNLHNLSLSVLMYGIDKNELPGRSGYHKYVTNYFRPGPDGPSSNEAGDFSGLYPAYVTDPTVCYCPAGAISLASASEYPWYFEAPWHRIFGRYITYDYFGQQREDMLARDPPLDVDDEVVLLAAALDSPSESVLLTDVSIAQEPARWSGQEHDYEICNHPGWAGGTNVFAPFPREGTNIAALDGSVRWAKEADTKPRLLWTGNSTYGYWKNF